MSATAAPATFDPATQRTVNKVDPTKVQPGHMLALVYYVKVDTVAPKGTAMNVTGLDGQGSFTVSDPKGQLIPNTYSADYFASEERVTMTKAAEILISSYNRPLTVRFQKQDKKMRTLRGRLISAEPLLGRSHVEDLDESGNRMRQVDHRTIEWLIVDGVKYTVK